MRFKFLFLILISGCALFEVGLKDSDVPGRFYEVRAGDSLSKIAARYRISENDLMEINGVENAHDIAVGKILYLPDSIDVIISRVRPAARERKASVPKKNDLKKAISEKELLFPVPRGQIFKHFSKSRAAPYDGIGIKATLRAEVIAADAGKVLFVGDDQTKFGLLVIIEHAGSLITVYTHLSSASVKAHERVRRGQVIGAVGISGGVKTPRLHFQVRRGQRPEDPMKYLKRN